MRSARLLSLLAWGLLSLVPTAGAQELRVGYQTPEALRDQVVLAVFQAANGLDLTVADDEALSADGGDPTLQACASSHRDARCVSLVAVLSADGGVTVMMGLASGSHLARRMATAADAAGISASVQRNLIELLESVTEPVDAENPSSAEPAAPGAQPAVASGEAAAVAGGAATPLPPTPAAANAVPVEVAGIRGPAPAAAQPMTVSPIGAATLVGAPLAPPPEARAPGPMTEVFFAGLISWLMAYGGSIVISAVQLEDYPNAGRYGMIPFAGPFMAVGELADSALGEGWDELGYLAGALQIATFALLTVGTIVMLFGPHGLAVSSDDDEDSETGASPEVDAAVLPRPNGATLELVGRF